MARSQFEGSLSETKGSLGVPRSLNVLRIAAPFCALNSHRRADFFHRRSRKLHPRTDSYCDLSAYSRRSLNFRPCKATYRDSKFVVVCQLQFQSLSAAPCRGFVRYCLVASVYALFGFVPVWQKILTKELPWARRLARHALTRSPTVRVDQRVGHLNACDSYFYSFRLSFTGGDAETGRQ
jgi:hypothetical protein